MPNSAKYLLSFLAGALCIAGYAFFVMKPNMQHSIDSNRQDVARLTAQLATQSAQLTAQTAKLTTENAQLTTATAQETAEAEALKAKFARGTVLYEQPVSMFGKPLDRKPALKVWLVKADVEPVYIGTGEGFFTHYDPKSQTETVKFPAQKK